jgi:uncharacterized protein
VQSFSQRIKAIMPTANFAYCQWKNQGKILRGSLHLPGRSRNTWVVFAHGFTGHRLGPGYLYVRIARELAEIGISSLRFDFSGAGESDGQFQDMTIAAMQSDLLSAIRFIKHKAHPAHIILLGHSLGGCIAALCAKEKGVDGMILLAPVADPLGIARRRKEMIARGHNARGYFENGPHEMGVRFLDGLKDISPSEILANHFKGKLILFQGDADPSISMSESKMYVDAAQKAGIQSSYHIMEKADHNFSTVSAHQALLDMIIKWLKESYK